MICDYDLYHAYESGGGEQVADSNVGVEIGAGFAGFNIRAILAEGVCPEYDSVLRDIRAHDQLLRSEATLAGLLPER